MSVQISGIQMGILTGGPSSLSLEDLSNVSIVSPQTGQYLRYNSGISEWQNSYLGFDIYSFLNTNMGGSNGVSIVYTPGVNTIGVSLSLSAIGDATGAVTGSTLPLTLTTVNSSPQTDQFRKITVNAKGLVTATSAISPSDIISALGYTPVSRAGDTMTGNLILNSDPVTGLGAATKQYVDNIASGLRPEEACYTATTATLATESGGTISYDNGTSGVGATLTTTGSFASLGGVALAVSGRVLVKNEVTQTHNGIYVRTSATVLTRSSDFDNSPPNEIAAGDFTYIQAGTNAGTQWVMVTTGTITVGTSPIVFTQLSGAGTYSGGTGINVAGTVISNTGVLTNTAGSGIGVSGSTGNVTISNTGVISLTGTPNQVSVSSSTGAITVSLPSSVSISGTMTANQFSGAGTGLTGSATSLSIGGSAPAGSLTGSTLAAAVTNSSLTTLGTLSGITVSGAALFRSGLDVRPVTSTHGYISFAIGNASNSGYIQFMSHTSGIRQGYIGFSPTDSVFDTGIIPYIAGTHSFTGLVTISNGLSVSGGSISGAGTGLTGSASSLNAGSATILQNSRTINGVSFNGSSNITISAATNNSLTMNNSGSGSTSGTTFDGATARTISYNTIGAPSTAGIGATGTWSISVTGNSATVGGYTPSVSVGVPNRVVVADVAGYISNSYFNGTDEGINGTSGTVTGILTKRGDNYYRTTTAQSVSDYISGTTNIWSGTQNFQNIGPVGFLGQGSRLTAYSSGVNSATMTFHRSGSYGVNMGLDADNVFRLGGWSDGLNSYRLQITPVGALTLGPAGAAYIDLGRGLSGGYDTLTGSGVNWGSSIWGMGPGYIGSAGGASYSVTGSYGLSWLRGGHSSASAFIGEGLYVYQAGTLYGGIGTIGLYSAGVIRSSGNAVIGGNIYPNAGSNYLRSVTGSNGGLEIVGTTGAYGGISFQTSTGVSLIYDTSGNGGGYHQTSATWQYYWNQANLCLGIGGSSTSSSYKAYVNGALYATGDITAFSDRRVKDDIQVISESLEKVKKLRGVTYLRNDNGDIEKQKRSMGVIAQEVFEVIPEVVTVDESNNTMGVAYGNIVGLLIEAIKELNSEVELLKQEISSLKG